ncbi:type II secretion system F family protein [Anaeromyxobacter sp. PSR-1]|uniref:type II secretion system F family protein n=1 Tax=unclassified Anaeromyxobacter TaxID=2620896 RepID=UPI0005DFE129|nr:type II secretion system F family protein [Anaeromyxobacter sp. PSR-1]GAO02268.1 bacterial type II secretion system protein F domain protein [Anaeromyxobacter sp. PSR-1]
MREVMIAAAAVAIFAGLEAAYHLARYFADRRSAELRRRLHAIGRGSALDADLLRRGRLAKGAALQQALQHVPGARGLERLLEQADSSWTVARLGALTLAGAVVAALLGVSLRSGGLGVAGLTLGGAALPILGVLSARAKRSAKLSEQLPEALDMMARSLRAGHAVTSAFQVVASEMPEPICVEFARAYEEQRLGLTLERAVVQMSERCPGNGDMKIFAVSAVIQRETGGNLAEILDQIGETIRQRYRFYGKLRALTGEGRASAVVLGALPFAVAVALSILNPEYLMVLPGTARGQMIILGASVSWVVGLLWLYRLTQVDL